ncbi:MAG TPA: TRAP transporter large permease subunit, partial [Oceanithermus sp.]|nr:TRAP transporter large permease subunit [Oceanithermus sp.]
ALHYAYHLFMLGFLLYVGLQSRQGITLTQFYALVGGTLLSALSPLSPLSLPRLADALVQGAKAAIPVSVATAAAGIVVGVVGLTGVGLKFSGLVLSASGGVTLVALVLVAVASLVLGMGLPVTASYIVLVILAGPALADLGVPLIIAHLVVFWLSQDSNVTPPVALAAYAASGLAQADPMRSGFMAWKFAKGLYLIPLLMVYRPGVMLEGGAALVAKDLLLGLLALAAFVGALEGFLFRPLAPGARLALLLGGVLVFFPGFGLELLGAGLVLAALLWARLTRRSVSG